MSQWIPINDLTRLPESLTNQIGIKAAEVSTSGKYVLSQEVAAFESELSTYLGISEVVGVGNGTDALALALLAAGITHGDIVLTMANAGGYTTIAAKSIGAEPVFVDVSSDTLQMTVESLSTALEICNQNGLKPKALIVTHLFGQLNQSIDALIELAQEQNIVLIEDCAQSLGAKNINGLAGSFGDLATFSFYPTKNLGASGDGGAIGGRNSKLVAKARKLRQYGWGQKYEIEISNGLNSRLDEIQAAILRIKLPYLNNWNQIRREIYSKYLNSSKKNLKFFASANDDFVAHLAAVSSDQLNQRELINYFKSLKIATDIHYPIADHQQKLELKFYDLVPLPNTEASCRSIVSIPLFPELTEDEVDRICSALAGIGG